MTIKANGRQAKWRRDNPLRYLAHLYVKNALALGVIQRQPCEVCGAEKAECHHSDYSQPAAVRWLCRRCHARLHAEMRRRA
jgi:hypothetical protein